MVRTPLLATSVNDMDIERMKKERRNNGEWEAPVKWERDLFY